jgi:hypothetical protein
MATEEYSVGYSEGYQEGWNAATDAKPPTAQTEQEPVAWQWLDTATFRKKIPPTGESECWNPLYTSPPKRQPLTDAQLNKIVDAHTTSDHGYDIWCDGRGVARAIEKAHDIGDKT